MADIRIPTEHGEIDGYLATPLDGVVGPTPWPGVVIVHDGFGMGDDIRSIAERFATAGYLAVVPNLFTDGSLVRCVMSVFRQMRAGSGKSFDVIDAARRMLVDRTDCTGRVGVVGFCLGGGFALLTASRGFAASAPYYGMLPSEDQLEGACPIVASFGRKDRTLKGAAARLAKTLTEKNVPHDVKEYPDAGHGFANRTSLGPFGPILRLTGIGYHHESSEDAWRRVLTFFAEHLRED